MVSSRSHPRNLPRDKLDIMASQGRGIFEDLNDPGTGAKLKMSQSPGLLVNQCFLNRKGEGEQYMGGLSGVS